MVIASVGSCLCRRSHFHHCHTECHAGFKDEVRLAVHTIDKSSGKEHTPVDIDWIAFSLITVFYIIYFGKQIAMRKQGIDTARLAKGNKPAHTQRIELALMAATFGMAVAQYTGLLFGKYLPAAALPSFVRIIGWVLMLLGILFFLLAITAMHSNWRAGIDETQKTSMVTGGIYRISRNPTFVGFDLFYLGSLLAIPNLPMLLFTVFTVIMMHLQIRGEEKYLPTVFGQEYITYKAKTPRYLFI